MQYKYTVITNNPLAYERLKEDHDIRYEAVSYEGVLHLVRDEIHQGAILLSHPLSGSVKPNETPYKSVLVKKSKGTTHMDSVQIIESAIHSVSKFEDRTGTYGENVLEDFRLIDWGLLEGALASADVQ